MSFILDFIFGAPEKKDVQVRGESKIVFDSRIFQGKEEKTYDRGDLYEEVSSYYGNPVMVKVKDAKTSSVTSAGIYACKVECLLCTDKRYIFAIVDMDVAMVGTEEKLSNLIWNSFQTRTSKEMYKCNRLVMNTQQTAKKGGFLASSISVVKKDTDKWVYKTFEPTIYIDILKNEEENLSEKGTVKGALDTFSCSLNII
jgi:hypothetical protein